MTTSIEAPVGPAQLSEELAELAHKVRESVVVVRSGRRGSGSGVVWNDSGLVITNHHVVNNSDQAEVILADHTSLRARVVRRDHEVDLAALQIEGSLPLTGLVPAEMGDSKKLRVGELVMVVGNPMGEHRAVTLGVVSGGGRVAWPGGRGEVVRVAITLRPGNSGGALADAHGRVIGIPNMVVGSGLALAVPSHVVQRFLKGEGQGRARFGFVGQWAELPQAVVARHKLPVDAGFLLIEVLPDSPAERAGLSIGDTLVGVAQTEPDGPGDLLGRLAAATPGQPVKLAVVRGGEMVSIEVIPEG